MISDLRKIRRDGNVIPESMTIQELSMRGWSPDKVVEVTWNNGGQPVELRARYGVLAKTLPGRDGVAWLEDADETGFRSNLSLLNADGSVRHVLPATQMINGRPEAGTYCWYEPARSGRPEQIGVVFRRDRDQMLFQIDIDVRTGTTVGTHSTR